MCRMGAAAAEIALTFPPLRDEVQTLVHGPTNLCVRSICCTNEGT